MLVYITKFGSFNNINCAPSPFPLLMAQFFGNPFCPSFQYVSKEELLLAISFEKIANLQLRGFHSDVTKL